MAEKSCDLVEQLKTVPDPRRQCANLRHLLEDVLILGFRGTLAGCDDFVEIAEWAALHEDFFRSFLELPNGIPSHDTIGRVFAAVNTHALQAVLIPWLQSRRGAAGDLVHIDGKAMRGTRVAAAGLSALHVVSAWAGEAGLTLGQVAVDEKSNEITAIPKLLELLDLRGKVVTIDAMGCQKEIAAAVIEGGADYVLAVKDNQPTLHAQAQAAFEKTAGEAFPFSVAESDGHGRREVREVRVLPASPFVSELGSWAGLLTLVMVTRWATCVATGVKTCEVRYFISSLRPDPHKLGRAIRSHWSIESMHWVLDVVFGEDARRVEERAAAENVAFMNRLALSLLRGDKSKGSLKVKRKKAGWDVRFLAKLIGI